MGLSLVNVGCLGWLRLVKKCWLLMIRLDTDE